MKRIILLSTFGIVIFALTALPASAHDLYPVRGHLQMQVAPGLTMGFLIGPVDPYQVILFPPRPVYGVPPHHRIHHYGGPYDIHFKAHRHKHHDHKLHHDPPGKKHRKFKKKGNRHYR